MIYREKEYTFLHIYLINILEDASILKILKSASWALYGLRLRSNISGSKVAIRTSLVDLKG